MRILLCEDEPKMRSLIRKFLESDNYEVIEASDGEQALELFYTNKFDLAILDWMIPKIDGLSVAKQMKAETDIKILMLTAKNLPDDEVKALTDGVDDYLTKPFHAKVLLVRTAKLLGITNQKSSDYIQIFANELRLVIDQKSITLTKKEFELFFYFYQNQGMALTREQILLRVWGMDNENDERTVDSFVRSLRDKIGKDLITTVYGVGYKFEISKK